MNKVIVKGSRHEQWHGEGGGICEGFGEVDPRSSSYTVQCFSPPVVSWKTESSSALGFAASISLVFFETRSERLPHQVIELLRRLHSCDESSCPLGRWSIDIANLIVFQWAINAVRTYRVGGRQQRSTEQKDG